MIPLPFPVKARSLGLCRFAQFAFHLDGTTSMVLIHGAEYFHGVASWGRKWYSVEIVYFPHHEDTMPTKIDWISFTLPLECVVSRHPEDGKPYVRYGVRDLYPQACDWVSSFPDLKETGGNRIFDRGFHSKLGGFSIFQKQGKPFTLFEFTGTGVEALREAGLLAKMIVHHKERLTRIDIAMDWECDVTPKEFAEQRDNQRFEHYCDIYSETGSTYYVGSKKSERFCRVYRYSEPHPRSHLLRAEFQLKTVYAKQIGAQLRKKTLSTIGYELLEAFGFCHHLVIVPDGTQKFKAPRANRSGNTERWLLAQVLPAIKKLVEEGNTDVVELFNKRVYDLVQDYLIKKENTLYGTQDICSEAGIPTEDDMQLHRPIP